MSEAEKKKLGVFPFIIGGLSFIPLLGIPLGIVLIIWGLATSKQGGKWLALTGLGGILCSVILYSSLFYVGFVQKGGVFDELRAMQTQQNFPMAIQAIEYYRLQHGKYPANLDELINAQAPGSAVELYLMDPEYNPLSQAGGKGPATARLYYELIDENHYYLLATGPDRKPFTNDDLLPEPSKGEKTGLLIKNTSVPPATPSKDR